MNLDRLHSFSVAARELNFTRAARRLNLSQPAITQQIRELENELGVLLFERRGRSLALTPAGERLLPLALDILREVELAREAVAEYKGGLQGVVRLGASTTAGIYLLPYALGSFSRQHSGVRASLQVTEIDIVIRGLHEGNLDLALLEQDISPGSIYGWSRIPLMDDELVLIAPPGHPWRGRECIEMHELEGQPIIMRQTDSATRNLINDRLAAGGFNPAQLAVRFELGHTEGIKRAVMAGLGIAFASHYAVATEVAAGWLIRVPVRDLRISRYLWLIRPADKPMSLPQERFCQMLLSGDWLPPFLQEINLNRIDEAGPKA